MDDKKNKIIHWDKSTGLYSGQGLIDLQVNGIVGIDFNNPALAPEDVLKATRYLLSRGVTTFFPTFVTNSDENILSMIHALMRACNTYPLVKDSVGGIHLEGPFISPREGARGAHDQQYIKPPDWGLMERFQQAANGEIKLVTLAPEWDGSCDFIRKCRENNILVSMGHSLADTRQIEQAVDAGMTLSTHLGNGVPLMLKRHPNVIWDQLADDRLFTTIIADGHHIPDSFIKVVVKTKAEKTILVSDTIRFAGMPSGEYESTIGENVILDSGNRLSLKGGGGLLAGAARNLLEDVETMINHGIVTLNEAWKMASVNVTDMLGKYFPEFKNGLEDKVYFTIEDKEIKIRSVTKKGKVVYEL